MVLLFSMACFSSMSLLLWCSDHATENTFASAAELLFKVVFSSFCMALFYTFILALQAVAVVNHAGNWLLLTLPSWAVCPIKRNCPVFLVYILRLLFIQATDINLSNDLPSSTICHHLKSRFAATLKTKVREIQDNLTDL